jgi:Mce-associated membrane protein
MRIRQRFTQMEHKASAAVTTDDPVGEVITTANVESMSDDVTDRSDKQNDSQTEEAGVPNVEESDDDPANTRAQTSRGRRTLRALGRFVVPALALLAVSTAAYLKWQVGLADASVSARAQSIQAATDGTIAMLSYKPDNVENQLHAARDRLTGKFRDAYTSLTNDVVIPGAKQKNISVAATVPAASSMSTTSNHAVVLVFINQTTTIGNDPVTETASSVRVTLDRVNDRWLISDFTPV